jgi:hypothetical protein
VVWLFLLLSCLLASAALPALADSNSVVLLQQMRQLLRLRNSQAHQALECLRLVRLQESLAREGSARPPVSLELELEALVLTCLRLLVHCLHLAVDSVAVRL